MLQELGETLLAPISQRYAYVATAAVRALPCFSSSLLLAFRGPATSTVHLAEPIEVTTSFAGAGGGFYEDESVAGAAGRARNLRKRPRSAPPKLEYRITISAGCAQGVVDVSVISAQPAVVGVGAERPSVVDGEVRGGAGGGAGEADAAAISSRAQGAGAVDGGGGGGGLGFPLVKARSGHGGAAQAADEALDARVGTPYVVAGGSLVSPGRDVVHSIAAIDETSQSPRWKSAPSISPLGLSSRDGGHAMHAETLAGLAAAHSSDDQIMFAT